MLHLHHSNRLETLAGVLSERMRAVPGDPLEAERIVVAHRSMARWLTLELASAQGIAANLRFELPADFAWSIMRAAVPGIGGERAYNPARLRWRIYDALPGFAEEEGEPSVAPVRGYLAGGGARERFGLADRLAGVFDRCLLYRPDWIRTWARSPPPHWQARLWQRLVEAERERAPERPAGHWVASIDAFRAALAEGGPEGWPRRASFFAVPSLSPSYLEVLHAASEWLDLDLFLLDPCRDYWGDIRSPRESRLAAQGADPGERYYREGNELLAAWGRAGRDMIDAFIETETAGAQSVEHFVPPEGLSRLAEVQRDILDLRLAGEGTEAETAHESGEVRREPAPGACSREIPAAGEPEERADTDDSLRIHVCHSAIREAEVLHDRLLGFFDRHPDVEPADVLVLVPDLGRYGPAIEAVFGAAQRIPVNVARVRASDSQAVGALIDLLALPGSRYPAEAVLAPLRAAAVRARFGLEEADLPLIRAWLREAGVRWGVDPAHRGTEHLPETGDHTWRQGLRRLLLGYAAAPGDDLVAGAVPCPPAGAAGFEAGPAEHEVLGRFLSYCEAAFELRSLSAGEWSAAAWTARLRELVARFFATEAPGSGVAFSSVADDTGTLRDLVRGFGEEAGHSGACLPFDVVRDALRERAEEVSADPARLADGVTVARLAPGSIFPAQLVWVAGLNEGEFPRSPSALSFDLVAAGPARRGDRDPRHEDRLAFLEALLAARRSFVVSYTGRSLRDDAALPPSVVVDELRDYLAQRFRGGKFEVRHPLQPFSPRYFPASGEEGPGSDVGLFSYSAGMRRVAEAMLAVSATDPAPARFDTDLPDPGPPRRRAALSELIAFFAHPTRYFLRERLGLRLDGEEAPLDENEPFELDGLDRYLLRARVWERMRAGTEARRSEEILRGSGSLPQRGLGLVEHERTWEEMQGLHSALDHHRAALDAPPVPIDLEVAGFRVEGEIEQVGPAGLLWWRIGGLRPQDRIGIRLRQLALAAAGHDPVPATALSFDRKSWKTTELPAPGRAEEELERWIEAWSRGLAAPLPFYPATSWAYAECIAKSVGQAVAGGPSQRRSPEGKEAMEEIEHWIEARWRERGAPDVSSPATSRACEGPIATAIDEAAGHARGRAEAAWSGGWYSRGESLDPYLALACEDRDPVTDAFRELAIGLLVPWAAG